GRQNITRAYSYDSAGRLIKVTDTDHMRANAVQTKTYAYDLVGNRIEENLSSESRGEESSRYAYNSLNQLTETALVDYSSAEPGSGVEEPAVGEETTEKLIPQRSYSYDKNGNEISVKEYSKNLNQEAGSAEVIAERINTYDPANRLSSLTDTKAGKTILAQENEYNGAGQRIKKTEGLEAASPNSKNYYYQAGQVLYTENQAGSNAAKISAFNLLGISDNIIATERKTTNPKVPKVYYFYNKDLRASTTSILAESGAAVKAYKYDEFGNTQSFGNLDNEIAYTGGIYDKSTQLYYLNARYYNPEDGRFITQDSYRGSKEDPGTWHLYAYCGNNPVNYVDPSGHKFESILKTLSSGQKKKLTFSQKKSLKKVPSKKCHFTRNENNTGLPATQSSAKSQNWTRHWGDAAHQFNQKMRKGKKQIMGRNKKYFKGNREVIYYYDGTKNNTPEDRGSYNYDPNFGEGHNLKDVVPWVVWGNSSSKYGNSGNDRTTPNTRKSYVSMLFGKKENAAVKAIIKLNMWGTVRN
ncbi:MAG: RHS repeat domain-containing protein, partial [Anaerovoracaceae bacterium]